MGELIFISIAFLLPLSFSQLILLGGYFWHYRMAIRSGLTSRREAIWIVPSIIPIIVALLGVYAGMAFDELRWEAGALLPVFIVVSGALLLVASHFIALKVFAYVKNSVK